MAESTAPIPDSVAIILPDVQHMQSFLHGRSGQCIRDWASAEEQALRRHILKLRALHNTTSLPNSLPNEVFVSILRRVADESDIYGKRWLDKLSGVCRYWRQTIVGTPTLWTDISLLLGKRFIKLCLVRSQDADLSLHIRSDWASLNKRDLTALITLLEPHYPRVLRLELRLDDHNSEYNRQHQKFPYMLHFLHAVLPRLVSMLVLTHPTSEADGRLQLAQSHLPKIRRLTLSGVVLQWETWPLPDLTHLRLDDVVHRRADDYDGDDLSSVLEVLSACRSLETFHYACRINAASPVAHPITRCPPTPIPLQRMRLFRLGLNDPGDVSTILAHVSLPRTACIDINVSDIRPQPLAHNDQSPFLRTLVRTDGIASLPYVRHVGVWLKKDANLDIWADETAEFGPSNSSKIWAEEPLPLQAGSEQLEEPQLGIMYGPLHESTESQAQVLRSIIRELDTFFPPVLSLLSLHGPMHSVDTETWSRAFAAFPHLKHIELSAPLIDLSACFDALQPTTSLVPCSHLRILELQCELTTDKEDKDVLNSLHGALLLRSEANSRLAYLTLVSMIKRPRGTDQDGLPADGMPAIIEEGRVRLESAVDKLELVKRYFHTIEGDTSSNDSSDW
ncbi:hypothetical protein FOMPIDRAFT_90809 [Fomitopsis schrenkii]|uniref:F-box domain-containing protein n=1 Tax=Fomitopsis schrenkii TaxID=2126942 RepID=S8FFE0_FOMSC|nr:hypothetical protein FOMPIDRAFT_90809 [Fomitopsis schrenkii]